MERERLVAAVIPLIHDIMYDSNDSEEEDETNEIVNVLVNVITANTRGEKPIRILNYYELTIPALTNKQFQMHFRVTKGAFEVLHDLIAAHICAKPNAHRETTDPPKQILMTLWLLATPDSFRSVGERFDVSKSTLWVCFARVVQALNRIARTIITWPTEAERRGIAISLQTYGRIPGVVGAIDGTYIPIKAPKENPEVYVNRKCFHGITLQAIADSSLKFRNCFTGYPSSVSDIRIFKNSDIYEKFLHNTEEYFTHEECILGDKAYPLYKWCIPPYINRGNLGRLETHFNSVHARMRQVVERTFALYFGRFRRMRYLDMNRTDMYAMTILAACVLHNICLLRPDDEIDNYIHEGLDMIHNNGNEDYVEEAAIDLHLLTEEGRQKRNNLARQLLRRRND